jgi:uncharacterized protein
MKPSLYAQTFFGLGLGFLSLLTSSCAPTIRLNTPEPVKIDVHMKVEVTTKNESAQSSASANTTEASPRLRQRNRITEVQSLKNDRIVGEGKDGLLHKKTLPPDAAYQEYAQKILEAENADRKQIYQIEADNKNKPLSLIVAEYARNLRQSAFAGEWIEQDDGSWTQR